MEIVINDMKKGYENVIASVLLYGDVAYPRNIATHEVVNASVVLTDPTQSLPLGIGRKLNTKIAAVEALQLLGGVMHPAAMLKASPHFADFMDGGTFHGGYGQRTRGQLSAVVDRLRNDPHTRRAVLTMWDPLHDLFTEGAHDYPCTIALQFLIRDDRLQLHTHMRSNDVWRGFAYDVFVFTQLQLAVASCLNLTPGSYFHHVTSLHMYATDVPAYDAMIHPDAMKDYGRDTMRPLVHPGIGIERTQVIARALLCEPDAKMPSDVVEDMWDWYKERV